MSCNAVNVAKYYRIVYLCSEESKESHDRLYEGKSPKFQSTIIS